MQTKFFKIAAAVLSLTLLFACGSKDGAGTSGETSEIEAAGIIAPETEIEIVEGTSAERVEIYTEKAQEAQTKLQLLLESDLLKAPRSSFLENIIPTALAEDAATEKQIAELLAEIQIYTELAAEAATESTNPEEIAELLGEVQETQTFTVEILEEVSNDVLEVAGKVILGVAEEITASIEEVDSAVAEVEEAIESGAEEISVDVETDVEEFLEEGITKINLRERINPEKRAERKIRKAIREVEKVKQKLIGNEVPQEEVDAILAEFQNRVEEAKTFAESGDFKQAVKLAKKGKQEANKIKNVVARTKDAKKRFHKLEQLAEEGDAVAAEKLEKLKPLVEAGKKFKEILDERKEVHKEFLEKAKEERAELVKIRREINKDLFEAKKQLAEGEISESDFEDKKEEIFEGLKTIREESAAAKKQLRAEHHELLQELNGLPLEEIRTKKEELKKEIGIREQKIRDDQKRLHDALKFGNKEAVETVKAGLRKKREKASEENLKKVKQFAKEKIEALPPKKREVIQQKRKALRTAQADLREAQVVVVDSDQAQEDQKEPPSCVGEGESLGGVLPGNNKKCCAGLVPHAPEGVVGIRGKCIAVVCSQGIFALPDCPDGEIVPGGLDSSGCEKPPICVKKEIACTEPICEGKYFTGKINDRGCKIYECSIPTSTCKTGCRCDSAGNVIECYVDPEKCPMWHPPVDDWCTNGKEISGGVDENGCPKPPRCVREETAIPTSRGGGPSTTTDFNQPLNSNFGSGPRGGGSLNSGQRGGVVNPGHGRGSSRPPVAVPHR